MPALLWGVALGNLLQGVPIDAKMNYMGDFFSLLSPYTLLTGVYTVVLVTLHGAMFLSGKLGDELADRARKAAWRLWIVTVPLAIVTIIGQDLATDMFAQLGVIPGVVPLTGLIALLASGWFIRNKHDGWAFAIDRRHDCVRDRHHLHDAVSARDGLQHQSGVEPDDLQRVVDAVHPVGDDDRRVDLRPDRVDVSRLDVLHLPQAHYAADHRVVSGHTA